MTTPSEEEQEQKLCIALYGRPTQELNLNEVAPFLDTRNKLLPFLADHTKATRKQVVAEIRKKLPDVYWMTPDQSRVDGSHGGYEDGYREALDRFDEKINKTLDEMEAEDA